MRLLEHANARSMLKSLTQLTQSLLSGYNVGLHSGGTKATRLWKRRSLFQEHVRPDPPPRFLSSSGEHDFEDAIPRETATPDDTEDSLGEALTNKCDGCPGPMYFLPLRGSLNAR